MMPLGISSCWDFNTVKIDLKMETTLDRKKASHGKPAVKPCIRETK